MRNRVRKTVSLYNIQEMAGLLVKLYFNTKNGISPSNTPEPAGELTVARIGCVAYTGFFSNRQNKNS